MSHRPDLAISLRSIVLVGIKVVDPWPGTRENEVRIVDVVERSSDVLSASTIALVKTGLELVRALSDTPRSENCLMCKTVETAMCEGQDQVSMKMSGQHLDLSVTRNAISQ